MNKIILFTGLMFTALTITAAAEEPAESFENDFESYNITEKYITVSGEKMLGNGKPVDEDYSDSAIYPNGANSVYEGNAGNNMFVYDSKGNEVYGGLPGWCGYYYPNKSSNSRYNQWNRRLTVFVAPADKSKNKMLRLEPSRNDPGKVGFGKENVDFSGVSVWETDICVTGGNDQKTPQSSPYEVSLYLTKNPIISGYEYEDSINILTFSGNTSGDGEPVDVYFMNEKMNMDYVMQDYEANSISYLHVKYVIDNSSDEVKHFIEISENGVLLAQSEPMVVENSADFFEDGAVNGIQYFVQSVAEVLQPRALIDNIKFHKSEKPQIINREQIETTRYALTNPKIDMKIEAQIAEDELSKIALKDIYDNEYQISCELLSDGIRVQAGKLEPQTVYRIIFNDVIYDGFFKFSDEIILKTKSHIDILGTEKRISDGMLDAAVSLKNNTDKEQEFISLVVITNLKNHMDDKIYYQKQIVAASSTTDIVFLGMDIPDDEYKATVYTINNFSGFNALSTKIEL